jgi:hypothetical protein
MKMHCKRCHKENKATYKIGKWEKSLSKIMSTTKRLARWYLKYYLSLKYNQRDVFDDCPLAFFPKALSCWWNKWSPLEIRHQMSPLTFMLNSISITFRVVLGRNDESKQHIQPYRQAHSHWHQRISLKTLVKFSLIGILKKKCGIRIWIDYILYVF